MFSLNGKRFSRNGKQFSHNRKKSLKLIKYIIKSNQFDAFFSCQVLFQDNLAECQDTRVKLHRNLPDGFNAKLYQTTEECSLPDLEQSNDNFGFRPIKEPEEATDELNFGQVRVQDCGLVNLAVVLTNPNAGYVEHLIQPIFVNCSLDFQVDFEGDLGETLIYPGVQPLDGAKMKIVLNTESIRDPDVENFESPGPLLPICNPKVMICMACFDEEDGDIFEDDFKENVIKDTTGSSFGERMMSLTNCQVLANGSFQDWQNEQNVLEKITNIPCPKYLNDKSEQKCGIVTYVDFMDKCLDVNVSNNMQILPFKMNTSQCKENHDDNCNVYPDFYSEGKTKIFSLIGKTVFPLQ